MKISTNAVNNYILQSVNHVKQTANHKSQSAGSLSDEEKKFFVKAYPDKKAEVTEYHYYNRNKKLTDIITGSMIDRKG